MNITSTHSDDIFLQEDTFLSLVLSAVVCSLLYIMPTPKKDVGALHIMKYVDWKSSVLACTMTIILAVIADERYF